MKSNFGFIIDESGNLFEFPNSELHHVLNLKQLLYKMGKKYNFGTNNLFYFYKELINENYLIFADVGDEDNFYMTSYIPTRIENINVQQKKCIEENLDMISGYSLYDFNVVTIGDEVHKKECVTSSLDDFLNMLEIERNSKYGR